MKEVIIKNEKEMIDFGKKIAHDLKGGDVLCLYGELGSGKTTLTKGIAQVFEIKKRIKSPTFTLMNIYPVETRETGALAKLKLFNRVNIVHIDTYRLQDEQELIDIGAEDYLGAEDAICIVEWPEKIEGLLKNKKCVKIRIEHDKNGRRIQF